MKKIIATISLLAGMSFSLAAHAATAVQYGTVSSGSSASIATGTAAGACAPLGSTVTVTTSAGVSGAYRCSEAYNLINVATCHNGGSAKPQTIECSFTPSTDPALISASVTDPVSGVTTDGYWNDSTCTLTDPVMTFETAARKAYSASSGGGAIAGVDLGEATPCNTDAVLAIVTK